MPRLPNPRRASFSRPLPWRLLAVAAAVTVGTIALGAVLVEPAPGRIVATDDDQVPELTGARPVSVAGPAPQEVVEGAHLELRPAPPTPSPQSAVTGRETDTGPEGDPRPEPDPATSEPSPLVTTKPEPPPVPSPSPSPSATSPTSSPTGSPTPTPEPSPEPDPEPSKPSWWPW